jgi:hypothetical protein
MGADGGGGVLLRPVGRYGRPPASRAPGRRRSAGSLRFRGRVSFRGTRLRAADGLACLRDGVACPLRCGAREALRTPGAASIAGAGPCLGIALDGHHGRGRSRHRLAGRAAALQPRQRRSFRPVLSQRGGRSITCVAGVSRTGDRADAGREQSSFRGLVQFGRARHGSGVRRRAGARDPGGRSRARVARRDDARNRSAVS